MVDIKAQWNSVQVSNAAYIDPEDSTGNTVYTYDNKRSAYYAQLVYRPSLAKNKKLKNIELVYRYSFLDQPEGSKEPRDIKQHTYGLNYWINFRSVMKLAIQSQDNKTSYFVQFALLF